MKARFACPALAGPLVFILLLHLGCSEDSVTPPAPTPGTLSVAAGSNTPANSMINVDDSGVVLLQLAFAVSDEEDLQLSSMTLSTQGSGDESTDVSAFSLRRDENGNGLVDLPSDIRIGSPTACAVDDGPVCFDGLGELLPAGRTEHWLVVADLSGSAQGDETFQVGLPGSGNIRVTGLTSADTLTAAGDFPVAGCVKTIALRWFTEVVDSGHDVDKQNGLGLDSFGRPHISYCDWTNRDLRYAHFDGQSWQLELIDAEGDAGYSSALVVDSADVPHVLYQGTDGLRHASRGGAGWEIESVDVGGHDCDLAMDTGDGLHVSYSGSGGLHYGHWDGVEWQTEVVAGNGSYEWTSIAVDTNGRPHIAYHHYRDGNSNHVENLEYAHWDGTRWVVATLDDGGITGVYSSIALDSLDQPHISYVSIMPMSLVYAHMQDGLWQLDPIEYSGLDFPGWDTSLVLDPEDSPHVAYGERDNRRLEYLSWDGDVWQGETPDDDVGDGVFTSLVLDAAGHPHISYVGHDDNRLMYACKR